MLTRSLCCFRGVSADAERRLWRAGCLSWDLLPQAGRAVSTRKAASLALQLPEARAAREGGVADYFLKRLPVGYRLRAWPDFAAGTVFLDVETTGLGPRDEVTVIGVLAAGEVKQFVRGRDLGEFLRLWKRLELLVTFNGTRFDLPAVTRTFGLICTPPHIDLLHEARAHGYVGGLKAIERALGVRREPGEEGDGVRAVELWRRHAESGDAAGLALLLRYNARDVLSLPVLARELLRRSFDTYSGPLPALPRAVACPVPQPALRQQQS